jgi:hypothetical protein
MTMHRWVLHDQVPDHLRCGWLAVPSLEGTGHGIYSTHCNRHLSAPPPHRIRPDEHCTMVMGMVQRDDQCPGRHQAEAQEGEGKEEAAQKEQRINHNGHRHDQARLRQCLH